MRGKGNGTLNNELVKAVGKSLMQGVGLNLVLTLFGCKLFPGDKKLGRGTILGADIKPFFFLFHTHKNVFPPDSLNLHEHLTEAWRQIILFSSLSPGYYFEHTRSSFPCTFTGRLPSLVVSLASLPYPTTLPTPSSHLPSPLPAISLLARPAADWLFPARAQ